MGEADRGLEEIRNIVANRADAAPHDHGHEPPAEEGPAEVLGVLVVLENVLPAGGMGHVLEFDGLVDVADICLNFSVQRVFGAVHVQEHLDGIVDAVVGHQPARRLGHQGDGREEEEGEDDLQGHRQPPLHFSAAIREAIVGPVGSAGAETDEGILEGAEEFACLGRQRLGLPGE